MTIENTYYDQPGWPYSFSYYHAGAKWALTVLCLSWADAEARAKLLNLQLDGVQAFPSGDIPEEFLPPSTVTTKSLYEVTPDADVLVGIYKRNEVPFSED